jgi:hypothetical protein
MNFPEFMPTIMKHETFIHHLTDLYEESATRPTLIAGVCHHATLMYSHCLISGLHLRRAHFVGAKLTFKH